MQQRRRDAAPWVDTLAAVWRLVRWTRAWGCFPHSGSGAAPRSAPPRCPRMPCRRAAMGDQA
eukprot:scaffold1978_cov381-Prasinococcus_capsulatus_cf.AAC.22